MQKKKCRGKNTPRCRKPKGIKLPKLSNYIISKKGVYSLLGKRYLKGCLGSRGYLQVWLKCDDGKRRWFGIHRLIGMAFVPNPHNLPVCHHENHDKLCNHPSNLRWTSYQQNAAYAVLAGRRPKGNRGKHMKGRKLSAETRQKMSKIKSTFYAYNGKIAPTQKSLAESLGLSEWEVKKLYRGGHIQIIPEGAVPPPAVAIIPDHHQEAPTYRI